MKDTPNDEYENFVYTHMEAAAKCLPKKTSPDSLDKRDMQDTAGEAEMNS